MRPFSTLHRFREGHGFSRAAAARTEPGALAPEGKVPHFRESIYETRSKRLPHRGSVGLQARESGPISELGFSPCA
jgi:hypothetical protein